MKDRYGDVAVTLLDGFVAQCEVQRAPNNFFDHALIRDLADCFADCDESPDVRAISAPRANTFVLAPTLARRAARKNSVSAAPMRLTRSTRRRYDSLGQKHRLWQRSRARLSVVDLASQSWRTSACFVRTPG